MLLFYLIVLFLVTILVLEKRAFVLSDSLFSKVLINSYCIAKVYFKQLETETELSLSETKPPQLRKASSVVFKLCYGYKKCVNSLKRNYIIS